MMDIMICSLLRVLCQTIDGLDLGTMVVATMNRKHHFATPQLGSTSLQRFAFGDNSSHRSLFIPNLFLTKAQWRQMTPPLQGRNQANFQHKKTSPWWMQTLPCLWSRARLLLQFSHSNNKFIDRLHVGHSTPWRSARVSYPRMWEQAN